MATCSTLQVRLQAKSKEKTILIREMFADDAALISHP